MPALPLLWSFRQMPNQCTFSSILTVVDSKPSMHLTAELDTLQMAGRKQTSSIERRRDSKYLLGGQVEVDEGFFETLVPDEQKNEVRKRGRGSQKQTMVMVFAESEEVENSKRKEGRPSRRCRYFTMLVCADMSTETAKQAIISCVTETATKLTDGYSTYRKLAKEMSGFECEVIPYKEAHIKLPWVHSAIGNLKRILNGIFHHTRAEYLQNYIDEFCYKLNRRYFGHALFQRALITLTLNSG
jgi:hypothetical protein